MLVARYLIQLDVSKNINEFKENIEFLSFLLCSYNKWQKNINLYSKKKLFHLKKDGYCSVCHKRETLSLFFTCREFVVAMIS